MEKKFLENLKHSHVETGQTIVLAVSGGIDSVTMLDLFAKSGLDLNFVIAHLNHGVREEAVDDEMFVMGLSEKYEFPIETKKIKKPQTGNLEEELRIERRQFLEEVGEKKKADYIALAHNANDQAETVLFNLLRGAGPAGLSGMKMS
jgi:tRNA(Ile)-lysidine synthase